jgi:hypothetical protein
VRKSVEVDLSLIDHYNGLITDLEVTRGPRAPRTRYMIVDATSGSPPR